MHMNPEQHECNLDLLTEEEKKRRLELLEQLKFSITDVKETDRGYDVSIFSNVMNLIDIDNLKNIESKCCPFLNFDILSEGGYTVLKIIGESDSKEIIRQEFGLLI